ncbi:hypothetical protein QR680_001127 [Steinernema hermaphroditum]|uniref:PID domain-containing protein n=1 Tax=Steinernema hermaphroditum TaxID=289476 RepID=A0AA39GZ07_9BILA|nr:hypothetical protein QR680_001127 [Steinernema hermaphroditum]
MVAQQKMKDSSSSDGSENGRTSPSSLKSKLAMLKRSSAKKAAANDPFRFQGNGVDFKGKLIGVRDVSDARGDEMCAEAMRSAKALVKSTGTHKQRIVLNISIQGLKIKDEKTQVVIHDFPVSRISFIARDTTDARAFGFVYSAQNGLYKFYGIKTAQTADHAVLSIRDMFQIVFEMKKKQIEEVKQKQNEESEEKKTEQDGVRIEGGVAVADLLDLETELHMIEQGFNQLQNIPVMPEDSWPSSAPVAAPQFTADPFGDSFTPTVNWGNTSDSSTASLPASAAPQTNGWSAFPQPYAASLPPPVTGAFTPNNPFVASAPVQQQHDPFDTKSAQHIINTIANGHTHFASTASTTVNWGSTSDSSNGSSGFESSSPGIENKAPLFSNDVFAPQQQQKPLVSSCNFATNFDSLENNGHKWSEPRKVTTLEEAFSKLVDMDSLVTNAPAETKKNPFEHLINPPKASLNSLSTPPMIPSRAAVPAPLVFPGNKSDPFNDDFFN